MCVCFRFGASLGIELAVESSATLHLSTRFDLTIADAAAYASLFGLMNIFSRGFGGYVSDRVHKSYSLYGRLIIHMIFMLTEGLLIFYFIHCDELHDTLYAMVAFAIFGQMSMGTCFGIVPYVDGPNTGTIAGIVGAGKFTTTSFYQPHVMRYLPSSTRSIHLTEHPFSIHTLILPFSRWQCRSNLVFECVPQSR